MSEVSNFSIQLKNFQFFNYRGFWFEIVKYAFESGDNHCYFGPAKEWLDEIKMYRYGKFQIQPSQCHDHNRANRPK